MKPVHEFIGARPIANHCPELLGQGRFAETNAVGEAASQATDETTGETSPAASESTEFDTQISEFLSELCGNLGQNLQSVLAGRAPVASAAEPLTRKTASLEKALRHEMVHYCVDLEGAPRFLVSFSFATALSLTDRIFGGDGKAHDDKPSSVPPSALLALEKIVRAIGWSLGALTGSASAEPVIAAHVKLARLAPFSRDGLCVSSQMTIEQAGRDPWEMMFSVAQDDIRTVVAPQTGASTHSKSSDPTSPLTDSQSHNDALSTNTIPFELVATLAEVKLPLGRLSKLAPGQVLPLSIKREVPIKIGDTVLGQGTVGTLDNHIALRLSHMRR